MQTNINKSTLKGSIFAPPSKSYTHRAIVMSALTDQAVVHRPLISADTMASIYACRSLGATIIEENDKLIISGIKGRPTIPDNIIDVANSGTTLRLIMAVSALCDGETVLTGDDSIQTRPNTPLIEALNQLGAKVISTKDDGTAPIVVKGPMSGGEAVVDGNISSQFFSALLIACPLCPEESLIKVKGTLKSRPYVEITLDMLKMAGISIILNEDHSGYLTFTIPPGQSYSFSEYTVPGDFSSASYLLAAGALVGEEITVRGLFPSHQGDAAIIPILQDMGADLQWDKNHGIVNVRKSQLRGVTVDVSMTPDLVPTLAVLGAAAQGQMVIENAGHVRFKETDRLHAMTVELSKMGVNIKEEPDRLIIKGQEMHGSNVSGWHDHRIVMALTVAGFVVGGTTIDTAESVNISFPGFFENMKKLGGKIIID
ncbi:MAG: 3-phosphoshikimate 1-carboxyvinyltransferase [Methanosarcinales archaeon]|nr:3-phosphoshikimate 1-carboxyvinyltransferase [Methanosarcinales archaeon]